MEKIIVTEEKAVGCRCKDCATFKINKLSKGVFCANGPSNKMDKVDAHNGCECQGCPIRTEGGFGETLFCVMATTETLKEIVAPKAIVDVDVTLVPVGADSGATKL